MFRAYFKPTTTIITARASTKTSFKISRNLMALVGKYLSKAVILIWAFLLIAKAPDKTAM